MNGPEIRRGRPVERPWGGDGVAALGLEAPEGKKIGEWWLPTDDFPLLVKIIDARENLSVQLHPDDETARAMGYPNGKTEAWYVLRRAPEGRLLLGLKPGVDPQAFLDRAERGEDVSDALEEIRPREGDVVFVPAGTVHAIGAGLVLLEVQQISDVTLRVFDWNRKPPRPLHIPEARRAIKARTPAGVVPPGPAERLGGIVRTPRLSCDEFRIEDLWAEAADSFPVSDEPELWFLREGAAIVRSAGREVRAKVGDFVYLPAGSGDVTIEPVGGPARFVRTRRP